MDVAGRIRYLRKKKGITQKDLASEVGISPGSVGNYENGSRIPDYDILVKLADYFKVSIDYILGRTEEQKNRPRPTEDPSITLALHRRGNFYDELPEEAKKQIDDFVEYIKHKYRIEDEEDAPE